MLSSEKMEALQNVTEHWQTLFLSNDLNNWVQAGYSGFHLTGIFLGLKFSLPVFFCQENFDLRGDFFAYSKQSEVVILHNVIDETEDVLGWLEC